MKTRIIRTDFALLNGGGVPIITFNDEEKMRARQRERADRGIVLKLAKITTTLEELA